MNKLKKGKMEKGITLIALIITIIVLLILAIVKIGEIKNDGLIQYAQNARKDYTDAANKEQDIPLESTLVGTFIATALSPRTAAEGCSSAF